SSHLPCFFLLLLFFFTDPPTTALYTLSLHDALPISSGSTVASAGAATQESSNFSPSSLHLRVAAEPASTRPISGWSSMRRRPRRDRKSTRLNSSHVSISYAVFCLKKKNKNNKSITTY